MMSLPEGKVATYCQPLERYVSNSASVTTRCDPQRVGLEALFIVATDGTAEAGHCRECGGYDPRGFLEVVATGGTCR